ncbi:retron Ec78 anti-phage system effector HNH endonuclease PtuB [Pectobacterium brasiliense]|uniref:retron Ec78 anti-phage system effector HNH endonuclease PtuB n=1 Tax=Pectobacterium brasiliense TaxID=180957 RepID=UPI00193EB68D|nr:retron Ec78 anti-phage system effector HNH endonuclease PtuB [Pectobacterium brasiliense]QRN32965.1 TIGR02646 family protein [Pectobacterium brasiliense]
MKVLIRAECPPHLDVLRASRATWNNEVQEEIWPFLTRMQGDFCAYCECLLKRKHIEHFRPRGCFPDLTFDWNNLFASCGDTKKKGGWGRCGIFKDNGAGQYDVNLLIKPDEDNPDEYLLFLTSGQVIPAKGISGNDLRRAEETIRVFNLNGDPALVGSRKTALNIALIEVEALYADYDVLDEEFWNEMLEDALESIKNVEFSTALKHAWLHNSEF